MRPVKVTAVRLAIALGVSFVEPLIGCTADGSAPDCADGARSCDGSGSASMGTAWLPDACSIEDTPFLQPECLDALRLACNEHLADNACIAEQTLSFGGGGFDVRCSWAKVVTFSDPAACTVQSVGGRCEAVVVGLDLCGTGAVAIPSESEVVLVCGGPLDGSSAVGADEQSRLACPTNGEPPDPLCACVDVAREAQ